MKKYVKPEVEIVVLMSKENINSEDDPVMDVVSYDFEN